ncbi:hypothetical protein ALC57_17418 [Trachymyrmex cornetzi]|nr:hypothetical protein ALC57_17418 [Trachymyrmex cornetzi]
MQSAIITLPEHRKAAEDAAAKRRKSNTPLTKKRRTEKVKRSKPSSSSSEEDHDFCLNCTKLMPHKMTKNNSIKCNTCERAFHLQCVDMGNRSYFTCRNCDSDLDS